MNNSEAGMPEREVGRALTAAHLRSARLVWEADRRVGRARQIVARQRDLVARVGEQVPIAVALLHTFERSLALFEEVLAGVLLLYRCQKARRREGGGLFLFES